MERIHVEISPVNLKFIKDKKELDYDLYKKTVNRALDLLRKKEKTTKKG